MKRHVIHVLSIILLLSGVAGAVDETLYDLRGPDPKPGMRLHNVKSFEVKGVGTINVNGQVIGQFQMSEVDEAEKDLLVERVEDGSVTRFSTIIFKKENIQISDGPNGKETKKNPTVLKGIKVNSEKTPSGWNHSLATGKPSGKQKEELVDLSGWDDDDRNIIPSGKHKIGATWESDGENLPKLLSLSSKESKDLTGQLKSTFSGLKIINDETCAVLETSGTLSGKIDIDDMKLDATFIITVMEVRSLRTGVNLLLQFKADGTAKGNLNLGNGNSAQIAFQVKAKGEENNTLPN